MFFFAVDCWAYRSHYCSNQGKSTLQAKEDTSPDKDTNCSADNLADPYSDNSAYIIALSSSNIHSHPNTN
jgi:hypothetical protein